MNCKSLTVTVKSAPRATADAGCDCAAIPVIATRNDSADEIILLAASFIIGRLKQMHASGFLAKRNYSVITRRKI
jgi:hypothetical protein